MTLILPDEITPAIAEALGEMCFRTGPVAHLFRDTGETIPRKVESEQAFILYWFLRLAIEHGDRWREVAGVEIQRRIDIAKAAQQPTDETAGAAP